MVRSNNNNEGLFSKIHFSASHTFYVLTATNSRWHNKDVIVRLKTVFQFSTKREKKNAGFACSWCWLIGCSKLNSQLTKQERATQHILSSNTHTTTYIYIYACRRAQRYKYIIIYDTFTYKTVKSKIQ